MLDKKVLSERFLNTREQTEKLCLPLEVEDYVVQPHPDVSPLNGIWAIPLGFSKNSYCIKKHRLTLVFTPFSILIINLWELTGTKKKEVTFQGYSQRNLRVPKRS